MLLAIDIGNTNTVIGLFTDREIASHWRIQTDPAATADELAASGSEQAIFTIASSPAVMSPSS